MWSWISHFTSLCLSFLACKTAESKIIISADRAFISTFSEIMTLLLQMSCWHESYRVRKPKQLLLGHRGPDPSFSTGYCFSPPPPCRKPVFFSVPAMTCNVVSKLCSLLYKYVLLSPTTLVSFYFPIHSKLFTVWTMSCIFLYSLHCM